MKKIRLVLAGAALTAAVAPLASAPAEAMVCHPDFEVACSAFRVVCYVVEQSPQLQCIQLG